MEYRALSSSHEIEMLLTFYFFNNESLITFVLQNPLNSKRIASLTFVTSPSLHFIMSIFFLLNDPQNQHKDNRITGLFVETVINDISRMKPEAISLTITESFWQQQGKKSLLPFE